MVFYFEQALTLSRRIYPSIKGRPIQRLHSYPGWLMSRNRNHNYTADSDCIDRLLEYQNTSECFREQELNSKPGTLSRLCTTRHFSLALSSSSLAGISVTYAPPSKIARHWIPSCQKHRPDVRGIYRYCNESRTSKSKTFLQLLHP